MKETGHEVQYCILGAGIAGLSLADSLSEQGTMVAVVEKSNIAAGASGTPGGLVNPATGRRATKSWKAEDCLPAIRNALEKVEAFTGEHFFNRNGVLRPALTQKMADKMREQLQKTSWPDGWCKWLDAEEIEDRHPDINCVEGGLWIPVGMTVDVEGYLMALARMLEQKGVSITTGVQPELKREESRWRIDVGESSILSEHVVFATGYETTSFRYWKGLPLHPIKGQVACFEADPDLLSFTHSISSLGYIARIDATAKFIQGSTYEHDFDTTDPDEWGEQYLRKRLRRTLPELADRARLKYQWAGVRASTPNRKPILGRHPELPGLHVFTGLGSKGLLYGKFLGDHFADHLLHGTPLFKAVSIDRILNS